MDIVTKDRVLKNREEIVNFLKGTWAEGSPIIPVSALHKVNLDVVIEAIEKFLPNPQRDPSKPPRMYIARSFDVNKPGTPIEKLEGGVIGGTIVQGKFRVGDEVEIRPGIRVESRGKVEYIPLFTTITSLKSGDTPLKEAYPGGLIGVGTLLDPSLTKGDALRGNVVGRPGQLPPVWEELSVEVNLMERVVGLREMKKVEPLRLKERLALNIGTATTLGEVVELRGERVTLKLKIPVCAEEGARVAISRQIMGRWRLIGYGVIT
ncbi:MAG: translation initiation factor IF-2 subunit gamma [Thermofilum sp. ex4484_15]|nr:MAG: translation initiation factor IF-2 subunit gamma [Thermofilum sp. ex4484_15]